MENLYASIPQVGKLLDREDVSCWFPEISRALTAEAVASVLAEARKDIAAGSAPPSEADIVGRIDSRCRKISRRRIRKMLNGTGIILHTNMGRCPLASDSWEAAKAVNTGYSNLEFELETGKRGRRSGLVPDLIKILTGAQSALVVNNNAAAVLLMLTALARGREVIVSRGEQIQIGGGFRIPEILALSGARLVEVGTTNITTLKDYRKALGPRTAMVLVVHPSNFKIKGFTSKPAVRELAGILPAGVVLAVDQGSGVTTEHIPGEISLKRHLSEGAHLVCFSGDKILGGPQAGILAGNEDSIRRAAGHPLLRAFRPGKTVYSLLEETLVRRINGPGPSYAEQVYGKPQEELRRFGRRVLKGIPKDLADIVSATATTGGGSAPDEYFQSLSIELRGGPKPEEAVAFLRGLPLPIIASVEDGKVRLNLSTLLFEDAAYIRGSLANLFGLTGTETGVD
jgi:L-seryl-tRNA(Ser) seleniumtransferase